MNDLYNQTVVRNGKTYHYDPDHDIYYSRSSDESLFSKWAWIPVTLALAVVCYLLD
jgi:hypothetical protein